MAESNKKNLGDDFQRRPMDDMDTQAEGQAEHIKGQIELRFNIDTGKVSRIHIIPGGENDSETPGKLKIIESEDEPGVFHGIVYDGDDYTVVEDETTGEPVAIPNPDRRVSMYTRYDPERQQQGSGDAVNVPTDDTAADAATQATGAPADDAGEPSAREPLRYDPEAEAFIVDDTATDNEPPTQEQKDAFARRIGKSRERIEDALRDTRTYCGIIAQAFNESSLWFQNFTDAIAPAKKAMENIASALIPAIQEAESITRNLPAINPDYMRTLGETMRKWARENIVLLTMVQRWKAINGIDRLDDDNPIESDDMDAEADAISAEAEADRPIDALEILAAAYSETHGGINAIISDDGKSFHLPPEAEADINAAVEDYYNFHNSSGAESYVVTARLYAKTHFHPTDPHEIIISDRLTAISLRDFQFALTTRPNPTAFIAPLGTGAFTRFRYDEATGQVINVKTRQPVQETQTPTETASMMKTAADAVTTPDFVLLTALYSVLLRNAERFEGDNIIVPIKAFARELGVDLGGGVGHVKDLEKRFQVYDPYVGWINGQGLFAVLKFIKRDDANGTITFSAPYLNRLLTLVQQKGTRTYRGGRKTFLGHNQLVHASIYKERNQTAAAIVIFICDLLLQNDQQPRKGDTHVIGHIAFSTLADYSEFAPRIERTAATREKTRMLKACFTKALELLRTQSDAYQYFNGLELYTLGKDGKTKTLATVKGKNGELLDNLTGGKEHYNAIAPNFAGYNGILYFRHRGADKNWKHHE